MCLNLLTSLIKNWYHAWRAEIEEKVITDIKSVWS